MIVGLLAALVLVNVYVFFFRSGTSLPDVIKRAEEGTKKEKAPAAKKLVESPRGKTKKSKPVDTSLTWSSGSVQPGDRLADICKREGIDGGTTDKLLKALATRMDPGRIHPGDNYRVAFTPDGSVSGFEYQLSPTLTVNIGSKDGVFSSKLVEADTELRTHEVVGSIDSSLFQSIHEQGEGSGLASLFVDVFAFDLNFYIDQHKGDEFRLLIEKEYLDGHFLRYGKILAAEYSGRAGTFRAFWWKPPSEKQGRYFNEKGQSIQKTFLKTPLKFARVSSRFNPRRMHPVLHVKRGHFGVDYAAPTGTPIWAAASGRIVHRGRKGGAGNLVVIQHANGYKTLYMHLSRFRAGQKRGSKVEQKDVIGYVGATGLATGPHLHFSVKKNGHYVDPMKLKMKRAKGIAMVDKAAFKSHTSSWIERLAGLRTQKGERDAIPLATTQDGI